MTKKTAKKSVIPKALAFTDIVSEPHPRFKERQTLEPLTRAPMPHKVRILGKDISIGYSSEIEGFEDAGEMSEHTLSIKVRDQQLEIEEADTLLHETIHGIDYVLNLELTERQVRLVATALIGVFQDNPEFAAFVTRPMSRIQ